MSTKIILETRDIRFRFSKTGPWFFDNISLSFERGTINFIRGSNGAGKSTLFRLLQGTFESHEEAYGTIVVDGVCLDLHNASRENAILKNAIKIVQQKFDMMLADRFTFAENMQMAACAEFPVLRPLPAFVIPDVLLKRFAINYTTPVGLLSGGQRQILAILMALQKPTKLLLLDEPTAALDSVNAVMVMDFLKELVTTTGLTVAIICHDKELVAQYATAGYFALMIDAVTNTRSIAYVS